MIPKRYWLGLVLLVLAPAAACGQTLTAAGNPYPPRDLGPAPTAPLRWAVLPTDRVISQEAGLQPDGRLATPPADPPVDWKRLLRPRVRMSAEWEPEVDSVAIQAFDASIQMPLYPIFGPPPPMVTAGYSLTQLDAPAALDLPDHLHEFSLGLGWMRPINDRWMARLMLSGAFASDLNNISNDAWQLRAGGFAIFRPNDRWSFAFGALATGRDDLPVIPAVGAIWEPTPQLRFNLMMPKPRISLLLADQGDRQHWGYLGAGISGGTWAYQRADGRNDRVSYGEWRLVLGWEFAPRRRPGSFRPTGTTVNAELGYVIGRDFEFDSGLPTIDIGNALLLRTELNF